MRDITRRTALKFIGASAVTATSGVAAGRRGASPKLDLVGHTLLGNPDGGFSEGDQHEGRGLAAVGSFLTDNGTYIVDVSDPTEPERVGHLPLANTRNADVKFHPSGDYVFRTNEPNNADGKGGFEVLDVSDPSNPNVVAFYDNGHGVHNVTPYGDDYLLLTGTGEGVVVVDVSDPGSPERVGQFLVGDDHHDDGSDDHTHYAHDVTTRGDLGFVANWNAGLRIIDLSDPSDPEEVAAFDYRDREYENCHFARPHPDRDVVVAGDELALGEGGPKHVIEFDPDTGETEELAAFKPPQGHAVQATGKQAFWWTGHNFDFGVGDQRDVLFSGDYKAGVQVFDLSDPSNPENVDRYYTNEELNRVRREDTGAFIDAAPMAWGAKAQESGLVYATDMQTGLYVFELTRY